MLLISCDYFESKKISKETIIKKELETFTWNEVDTYPSFKSCDSFETKDLKKACFESKITTHVFENLSALNIPFNAVFSENIELQLTISDEGVFKIESTKISKKLKELIPNIDFILSESISDLPQIFPAIKRGQQVKTQFVLPVFLDVN